MPGVSIEFGTPVVAFALQSQVVAHIEHGLAISAMIVAVFYSLIAVWLHRRHNPALQLMVESYIALRE